MKKVVAFVLVLACVLVLNGCSSVATEGGNLLKEGKVKRVSVTSLPELYEYSFSGNDVTAIVDYLSNLNLIADFSENPNEYGGMTWVISLEYEDGDVVTVYHFGNMFIRTQSSSWYKMNSDEARRFDELLDELNK